MDDGDPERGEPGEHLVEMRVGTRHRVVDEHRAARGHLDAPGLLAVEYPKWILIPHLLVLIA